MPRSYRGNKFSKGWMSDFTQMNVRHSAGLYIDALVEMGIDARFQLDVEVDPKDPFLIEDIEAFELVKISNEDMVILKLIFGNKQEILKELDRIIREREEEWYND